ncbi:MAG: ComF family protein [Pseudomonadota bacterium]
MVLPDLCLNCENTVSCKGVLCPECWGQMRFISQPHCEITGMPFQYSFGERMASAEAIANPPPYTRARAVALHDSVAARLVSRLKFNDRTDLAPWMAQYMAKSGAELIAESDLIIPIPLHKYRHWSRRYNQSAELGRALAKQTGLDFRPEALQRKRKTARQVGLGREERVTNVRGAFRVPDAENIHVHGRSVLLIDDVITTGSTVNAATKALLLAKAAQVNVLTFTIASSFHAKTTTS